MNLLYLNSKFLRCLLILPLVGFFLLLPARGSYVLSATYSVTTFGPPKYITGTYVLAVSSSSVGAPTVSGKLYDLTSGITYQGLFSFYVDTVSHYVANFHHWNESPTFPGYVIGHTYVAEFSGSLSTSTDTYNVNLHYMYTITGKDSYGNFLFNTAYDISVKDAIYLCSYNVAYDPYTPGSLIVTLQGLSLSAVSDVSIDWSNTSISQDLFDVTGYYTSSTATFYAHTKQVFPGAITWTLIVTFIDGSSKTYTFSTLPCSSCGNLSLLSPSSGYTFSPNQGLPVVFVWDGDIKNLTSLYWKVTDSLGNQIYAENVDITKFTLKDNVYQYSYTLLLSNEDKYKIAYSWHTNCDSSVGYNEVSFEVKSSFTNILDVVTAIYNTIKGVFQFLYNLIAIIVALFIVAISYLLAAIYSVAQLLRLGLSIIVGWLSALVSPLDPLTNAFPVTMPEVTFMETKFTFDKIFYLFKDLALIRDNVPQIAWNFILAVMLVLAIPGRPVYKEQTLFGG